MVGYQRLSDHIDYILACIDFIRCDEVLCCLKIGTFCDVSFIESLYDK